MSEMRVSRLERQLRFCQWITILSLSVAGYVMVCQLRRPVDSQISLGDGSAKLVLAPGVLRISNGKGSADLEGEGLRLADDRGSTAADLSATGNGQLLTVSRGAGSASGAFFAADAKSLLVHSERDSCDSASEVTKSNTSLRLACGEQRVEMGIRSSDGEGGGSPQIEIKAPSRSEFGNASGTAIMSAQGVYSAIRLALDISGHASLRGALDPTSAR